VVRQALRRVNSTPPFQLTAFLHLFCTLLTSRLQQRVSLSQRAESPKTKTMKLVLIKKCLAAGAALLALSASADVGTLSGPFTHQNLQIFLVHGDARLDRRDYATLSEALEKGIVVVKETGNVQELSIQNLSSSTTVFLNSGDIVKGGRQDRTVRDDLILPPRSGSVPLATFCVEHGRWTGRGAENAAAFAANTKVLSSKRLKLAARYEANQADVWSGVAEQQQKLNENVSRLAGKSVDTRSAASSSSLQLTLENKDLESLRQQYANAFRGILDGKTDLIGFVYCINGEINCAEIYNHRILFRALWPKLLDAAITEAISECAKDGPTPRIEAAQVQNFFRTSVSGAATERTVWKTTSIRTYTSATTLLFETDDLDAGGTWLHKSFLNKGKDPLTVPLDPAGLQNPQQREYRSRQNR
jgi:hypothetical protein